MLRAAVFKLISFGVLYSCIQGTHIPHSPQGPDLDGGEYLIVGYAAIQDFDHIPNEYLEKVREMLLVLPGESHGRAFVYGLEELAASDLRYSMVDHWSGEIPAQPGDRLVYSRSFYDGSSWIDEAGEEDFWTNASARTMMIDFLQYMQSAGNPVDVFGFAWCWDMTWKNGVGTAKDPDYPGMGWAGSSVGGPDGSERWGLNAADSAYSGNSISMDTYLQAIEDYNSSVPDTITIYTTGPVDPDSSALSPENSEAAYQRYIKHEYIREYVRAYGGYLLDYADLLSYSASGEKYFNSWNGNSFPNGHPDFATGGAGWEPAVDSHGDTHVSKDAAIRLGKGLWYLLARIAGWDGSY
jgi:hypothetical protein